MSGKLKILGLIYQCNIDGILAMRGDVAVSSRDHFQMSFPSDLNDQAFACSVLHEIVEQINDSLAMSLCHENIERLETALYQVLTENGVNLKPLLDSVKGE